MSSSSSDLTDPERLRLIVAAFIDCKQIPEVKLVARQFQRETGRTVRDVGEIERAIEKTTSHR